MSDRTIPSGAPGDAAPLVITPAVNVPADYPSRVARAAISLAAIEPVVAAVAEHIGTDVMPTARQVWEESGAPAAVGEEFDARTGWSELNSTLHRLAMMLMCAAGEPDQPPEANRPAWYHDLG
jgi:hypothetical protein